MKSRKNIRGVTLVEIVVTIGIAVLMMIGAISFYTQISRGLHAAEQRLKLTARVHKLTSELIVHASRSNSCVLFKSASPIDFDGPNPADTTSLVATDRQSISPSGKHPAGDFVAFVYYEIPKANVANAYYRITKVEGYFLDPNVSSRIGKIWKVVVDLSAAPYLPADKAHAQTAVEDILSENWSTTFNSHTNVTTGALTIGAVITYSPLFTYGRGLLKGEHEDNNTTSTSVARLFYISNANSVIVCGQLYGTGDKYTGLTSDWRTYSQSFNFTITPRT